MKRFIIAAYVENKYGVLTRVSGLFMRRGFNIDSLAVGETEDPAYSRITVAMRGDDNDCEQVINQLKKLYIVHRLARKNGLDIESEKLDVQAEAFALNKGSRSPRAAEQFINSLIK